jgi:hypothetical protein
VSTKTLYDCDATVLLNVYICLVFVGKGYLAVVPSHLPHLRLLCWVECDEYVEEIVDAIQELEVVG